jgi:ADP-ribose pyrophosphatase YjhB (NUDIX family)
LPRVSVELDECVKDAALRALRETVGIEVDTAVGFGSLRHVVTNRRITLHGLTAHWDGIGELKPLACRQFAWVKPDDIDNYAVSSPQIELLSILTKSKLQPTLGV